jgi:predicted transcriptional regulator
MTNRRSKLEIYIDILEEVRNGVIIPTRIMYGANLSWKPLQQILKSLVTQELIVEYMAEEGDKRTKKAYKLTEKGLNVLRYFSKAKELVEKETMPQIGNWR